jgi:hypothetical protein
VIVELLGLRKAMRHERDCLRAPLVLSRYARAGRY